MYAYIAYQPIFNKRREIVGYELLYRDGAENAAHVTDNDKATQKVVSEMTALFGLSRMTDGFLAINFTRNLILDDFVLKLEPGKIVVQVKNTTYMDEELEDKIRALRDRGYIIALKNYLGEERLRPYLYLFDVVRVNFKRTNSVFQRDAIRKRVLPNTLFMADRVEREQDFAFGAELGYELFQGYLLGRPTVLSKEIPPLIETSYGQLLRILLRISPEIRWDAECAQIIQNDLMLSYLFPREVNALPPSSVPYAKNSKKSRPADMRSIIYRMGPHVLRRWVCLALMREFNFSNSDELPRRAYVRGLFMEGLASNSELYVDVRNGGAFLCGAFSLLEAVMGAPIRYLLREIGIPVGVWDALLGGVDNDYAALLRYVTRYEAKDLTLTPEESQTRLDADEIARLYLRCLNEADAAITNMDTPV